MTEPQGPRKQRTRQHVIADIGVHVVEGCILEAGFTAQRLGSDYGYDLVMNTFDEDGYIERGVVFVQVKAMGSLAECGTDYVYDVDIRDYRLWTYEDLPVIFVLFDATRRRAYWIAFPKHYEVGALQTPKLGAKTVRVRVPKRQRLNPRAIGTIRDLKLSTAERRRAGWRNEAR